MFHHFHHGAGTFGIGDFQLISTCVQVFYVQLFGTVARSDKHQQAAATEVEQLGLVFSLHPGDGEAAVRRIGEGRYYGLAAKIRLTLILWGADEIITKKVYVI